MNRKDRRRQAKLGPSSKGLTASKAPAAPPGAVVGGFAASDAFAFLANVRRPAVPLPPEQPQPKPVPEAKPPPEHELANAVYYGTLDALRAGRSVEGLIAAVREATQRADRMWAQRRPEVEARKTPPLACAAGCAWCCYQQVAVEPAEAIAIARHIERLPAEKRAAIEERLAAMDSKTRGMPIVARARLKEPCAFLVDGTCSIYEVRPLRCRGIYSRDAGHCRWAMENPELYFAGRGQREGPGPYPIEPTRIVDAALAGIHRAAREFGLPYVALELVAAVRTALAPGVSERYVAGEPVFADAALPPRDTSPAAPPSATGTDRD